MTLNYGQLLLKYISSAPIQYYFANYANGTACVSKYRRLHNTNWTTARSRWCFVF